MKFEEALTELRNGRIVQRHNFEEKYKIVDNTICYKIYVEDDYSPAFLWGEYILAEDWEIVK